MLFAVLARYTVTPSIVALVITYSLQTAGVFNWVVQQFAEVETNMNAIERLDHYVNNLEHEAPAEIPAQKPAEEWPHQGVKVEMITKSVFKNPRMESPTR